MTEEGPTLHSFVPINPTQAEGFEAQADTTIEDVHGNTTVLDDQDATLPDANETSDSINPKQDEDLIDDDDEVEDEHEGEPELDEEEEEENDEDQEEGASGTSVLPLSKIKKIFKTDPEHVSASEAAVFTTAIATELFIQYFTEQASLISRSEKRKTLQYKDFSSAVSNIEQLYFLGDTVPKTYNLKKLVEQEKVRYNTDPDAKPLEKGQTILSFGKKGKAGAKKAAAEDEELPESDDDQDVGDQLGYNEVDDDKQPVTIPDLENDDSTDDENDISNPEIQARKDRDHDIIMN